MSQHNQLNYSHQHIGPTTLLGATRAILDHSFILKIF